MQITGIVCEYNPLHLGHKKQIQHLKQQSHAVVCIMSGNFVQRGHPAIFDKMTRAKAALACGANLVLELPIPYALSSAEGFAYGAVEILSKLCTGICFGAENADVTALMNTAKAILQPDFSAHLRTHLDRGCSFPAARAAALEDLGLDAALLATPNNILAIEYCKAIVAQDSQLAPLAIHRPGSYHDPVADAENPSATAIRGLLQDGTAWEAYVPQEVVSLFENAPIHSLQFGQQAILYRLRTMSDAEFAALPYGSEGLWRKLMHAARSEDTLDAIIAGTKSKRYTRTRIDRMIMCAYLGITEEMLTAPVPYCRVLGFNDTGRLILNGVKETGFFVNMGERTATPYEQLEHSSTSLYGLLSSAPEHPSAEGKYRVHYQK